jgi:hypothetical protein
MFSVSFTNVLLCGGCDADVDVAVVVVDVVVVDVVVVVVGLVISATVITVSLDAVVLEEEEVEKIDEEADEEAVGAVIWRSAAVAIAAVVKKFRTSRSASQRALLFFSAITRLKSSFFW